MIRILSLCYTLTVVAAVPQPRAALEPLLTCISHTPDLSTFYSLFNGTGGDLGKPGPDFEERFNNLESEPQFTALAPTNEALARLPPGLLSALKQPTSYELLKSFLINHIAPGTLSDAELQGGKTIELIGGFTATFDQDGKISTNPNMHGGFKPTSAQASLVQTPAGDLACSPAYNGRVCEIDGVLDGFLTYFGEDIGGESNDLPPAQTGQDTIGDIIAGNSNLSTLRSILKEVDSDFLARLSVDGSAPQSKVYLAPRNTAFDALPKNAISSMRQPSNDGLTSFLLEFGFGEMNDGSQALESDKGFRIPIMGTQVLNAQVTDRICTTSGKECVWVVGRLLDPLCATGSV